MVIMWMKRLFTYVDDEPNTARLEKKFFMIIDGGK